MSQQVENDAEHGHLQGLLAKLEAHMSQQNRSVEKERWTLQQDFARLKAQQDVFRKEQASGLSWLEENRESLQQSRQQFLAEQQEILTRCYDEQRAIALERMEVARLEKVAGERDMMSRQMTEQVHVVECGYCLHKKICCWSLLSYIHCICNKIKLGNGTFVFSI